MKSTKADTCMHMQVVACNSLTALASNHWDNQTLPHVEMRNYALSFLFAQSSAATVPAYVSRAMTRMLSRITKLGWIECEAHRSIITQLERFFDSTARHYATGLTLLHDLVEEMDLPPSTRRGAILRRQFMLTALHTAFSRAIDTLLRIATMADPEQAALLGDAALQLAIRCLNFDFTGQQQSAEDDSDEISLPVPMSWRKDLNKPELIDLLWDYYKDSAPPQSSRALELLMLYTSVPRAIHESQEMHNNIGRRYLDGVRNVLEHSTGLEHADNYHMFCRLLGSLWDLSPLESGPEHDSWVDLAANFTVKALHDIYIPQNSLHFLLRMWSKLSDASQRKARIDASPNRLLAQIMSLQSGQLTLDSDDASSEDTKQALAVVSQRVRLVVVAYLEGRLEAISAANEGLCEDPLEDPEMLQEQLEVLPKLCGDQYSEIAENLLRILDRHMEVYRNAVMHGGGGIALLEGQLAWLVRVCASLIGGHYVIEHRIQIDGAVMRHKPQVAPNMRDGDQLVDADVTGRVLQLVLLLQREGERTSRTDPRLELAVLSFLEQLKQGLLYVDSAMDKDMDEADSSAADKPQSLPSFLMSLMGKKPTSTLPADVYRGIFKRIGLGDHKAVMSIVITKIVYNLRMWGDNRDVIRQTLVLLATLVQGGLRQPSGQMILHLDVTQHLLSHHSPTTLPFLVHPGKEACLAVVCVYVCMCICVYVYVYGCDAAPAFAPLSYHVAIIGASRRGSLSCYAMQLLYLCVCMYVCVYVYACICVYMHVCEHLQSCAYAGNERYRTMLYLTLSQLLAMDSDDVDASGAFERFIAPILQALAGLKQGLCVCLCVCVYIYICVCVYVCMYIHVCVCM
jgi:exportin-7